MAEGNPTRTFSKTIGGVEQVQVAHSPADAVRYQFDGWAEVTKPVPDPVKPGKAEAAKTSK